jgi:hypothetical protein
VSPALESAPIWPLSGGAFSLQVGLSGSADEGISPFVTLSEDDEFSHVLLGVIKGDAGTVLDFCAIKVPRNVYRPSPLHETSGWTNPTVEERWTVEAARLSELEPASGFVPRAIRPERASPEADRLPPLFFCTERRGFFSPPCPRCGGALSTCRDDARLAKAGLPLYSGSLERFLQCDACFAEDPDVPFYASEVSPELAGKAVLSAADLMRDLGEALAGGPEGDAMRAAFPCPDCARAGEHFRDALASGGRSKPFWEERWVPLTFYDSPFLLTGLDPFDLDEFADLLGGRPPETLARPGAPAAGLAAALHFPADKDAAPRGRWLFEGDGSGLDAVEILALKLAAFRQITQAVLEYSRALGRPHLDLHPRHLLFDLSRVGRGLPLFWNFQMRLHGISTAARIERVAGVADVVIPPRNPAVPYAPPEVLEFHLTPPRPAQLVLSDLEEETRTAIKGLRLHGKLTDPYGIFPTPRPQDWILVTLENEAIGLQGVTIACRQDPKSKPDPHELTFVSEPITVSDAILQRLKKATGVRIPGIRYKVYADFGTPSDLFSLGMILLRLLVGNDTQDARAIAQVVEKIGKRLMTMGEVTLGNLGSPGGTSALLERDPDLLKALWKANVFYTEIERRPERPNSIPDVLWKRSVLLAIRLATRVEGFSVCSDPGNYDEAHPRAKLEMVVQEVDLISDQLRSLLFQRQAVNLEIQQMLSEILEEKTLLERATPA